MEKKSETEVEILWMNQGGKFLSKEFMEYAALEKFRSSVRRSLTPECKRVVEQ